MKILFLFVISFIIGILCYILGISSDIFVMSTLYNAVCIVFSVGMGLIVTFSLEGVKNTIFVEDVRKNIRSVRKKFIILFSICTILLILEKYFHDIIIYNINIGVVITNVTIIFFICSIGYFIHNFIKIQTLKDEIFNKLLDEYKTKKHNKE